MSALLDNRYRLTIIAVLVGLLVLCLLLAVALYRPWDFRQPPEDEGLTTEDVQQAIDERGYEWTAEDNKFTDMSEEERQRWLGVLPSDDEVPVGDDDDSSEGEGTPDGDDDDSSEPPPSASMLPPARDAPPALDFRPLASPIRNQAGCGSCWAYSALSPVESKYNEACEAVGRGQADLSEQYLLSCEGSCRGHFMVPTFEYMEDEGFPREPCCPYRALGARSYCSTSCDPGELYRITGFTKHRGRPWPGLTGNPGPASQEWIDGVKELLVEHGPLSTTLRVQADFWHFGDGVGSNGVYRSTTPVTNGYHAVALHGYDTAGRYWIARNSWGEDWGEDGYFRISWDDEYSAFGAEMYSVEVDTSGNLPCSTPPPPPPPPDPCSEHAADLPRGVEFSDTTKEAIAGFGESIRVPCTEEGAREIPGLDIEAVIDGGPGDRDAVARATRTDLVVNGGLAVELEPDGEVLRGTLTWNDALVPVNDMVFELRSRYRPDPAEEAWCSLPPDSQAITLPSALERTSASVEPLSTRMRVEDGMLVGEVSVPVADYLDWADDCADLEISPRLSLPDDGVFVLGSVVPDTIGLAQGDIDITLEALPSREGARLGEATVVLVLPPPAGAGDVEPIEIPVDVRWSVGYTQYILLGAALVWIIVATLIIIHATTVDKRNYWYRYLRPRWPEDFRGDPDAFRGDSLDVFESEDELIAAFRNPALPVMMKFLRRQRWKDLRALFERCRRSFPGPLVFPRNGGAVELSSTTGGDRVYRTRIRELPGPFARIVDDGSSDAPYLMPLEGYFEDVEGRFLQRRTPVPLEGQLQFRVGLSSANVALISVAVGTDVITVTCTAL